MKKTVNITSVNTMEFKYIGEKIYYVPPQMEAHFKKNPLGYALALEGGGLKDKDIRRGLRKLFSLKITNQVMKHMIKSRSELNNSVKDLDWVKKDN